LTTIGKAADSSVALVINAYTKYLMLKAGIAIDES
jgi:hypothetical protein